MIELKDDRLMFRFPEIHSEAVCGIEFQRTLRIPDDNRAYQLPPGLGRFPMEHVEDHAARLPEQWARHGGVLLPMYQAEALWINFSSKSGYPFAVKVAAGKISAVTGEAWQNELKRKPQDYLVVPDQPWLDGFCVQKGLIRQFVAMPLGQGYTAEEQLTGAAEHGGVQVLVHPMKASAYEELQQRFSEEVKGLDLCYMMRCEEMGLAPGGLMRQEIYKDHYGFDVWDQTASRRCFVHILNSAQWQAATGKRVPGKPLTASDYTKAGLPWFEYYDDKQTALSGSPKLGQLDSVAAKAVKKGEGLLTENEPVVPKQVVKLGPGVPEVTDGKW